MILAHNKISSFNTNKAQAILHPQVLEFQQAVFPEISLCIFHYSDQALSMCWKKTVSVMQHVFFFSLFEINFDNNNFFLAL